MRLSIEARVREGLDESRFWGEARGRRGEGRGGRGGHTTVANHPHEVDERLLRRRASDDAERSTERERGSTASRNEDQTVVLDE